MPAVRGVKKKRRGGGEVDVSLTFFDWKRERGERLQEGRESQKKKKKKKKKNCASHAVLSNEILKKKTEGGALLIVTKKRVLASGTQP
jgi:hypothetical protein